MSGASEQTMNGVVLHHGDCLDVLARMPENSVDAVVCDPPYGLGFMGKHWDHADNIAFRPETWATLLRVLKPGGHLVAFSGTRTYHRMVVAIEDAGFEVRDQLAWVYGSGFPKSLDVSKAIDKAVGAEGDYGAPKSAAPAGWIERGRMRGDEGHEGFQRPWMQDAQAVDKAARQYLPGSDAAQQWAGWGTALKPAWEPICLARKPLSEPTVAANVLRWGTGALNIDATRIATGDKLGGGMVSMGRPKASEGWDRPWMHDPKVTDRKKVEAAAKVAAAEALGRWPANLAHDGSDDVLAEFPPQAGGWDKRVGMDPGKRPGGFGNVGAEKGADRPNGPLYGDSGSAARFFYCAKANKTDRAGSKHPTVKPVALMRWLVRMVTPPGGMLLDPFAGSGTTGQAAIEEGFDAILIEREDEYVADIRARLSLPERQEALL